MSFASYSTAALMRDTIEGVSREVIQRDRPMYRYATVQSVDPVKRRAMVNFSGEPVPVPVRYGALRPKAGALVRVDGLVGDRHIADVVDGDVEVPGLSLDYLPLAGGELTGDLTVGGNIATSTGGTQANPGIGTGGAGSGHGMWSTAGGLFFSFGGIWKFGITSSSFICTLSSTFEDEMTISNTSYRSHLKLVRSGTGADTIEFTPSTTALQDVGGEALRVLVNGSHSISITEAGQICAATHMYATNFTASGFFTGPSQGLSLTQGSGSLTNTVGGRLFVDTDGFPSEVCIFRNSGSNRFYVRGNHTSLSAFAHAYSTISDARTKQDIEDVDFSALDAVRSAFIHRYRYKDEARVESEMVARGQEVRNPGRRHLGFIASEVPEECRTDAMVESATDEENTGWGDEALENVEAIDLGAMLAVVWKAVQELDISVGSIGREMAALKGNQN